MCLIENTWQIRDDCPFGLLEQASSLVRDIMINAGVVEKLSA